MKQYQLYFLILVLVLAAGLLVACNGGENKDEKADSIHFAESATSHSLLDTIRVCTEMLPPSGSGYLTTISDTLVLRRNSIENDTVINNNIQSFGQDRQSPMKAAIWTPFLWHTHQLKVSFLDGEAVVQEKVKAVAREWEKYCGIRFLFGSFPDPDITVSFRYRGSWSYIGNYSRQVTPSMNLGWLTAGTDPEEYNRVVLHEFGHAIGFIHEHSNPDNNPIQWRDSVVYEYYKGPPNNWSQQEVNINIFQKYARQELNGTAFDPKSIMLYAFPKAFTTNGYSTQANSRLSANDKWLAGRLYPGE